MHLNLQIFEIMELINKNPCINQEQDETIMGVQAMLFTLLRDHSLYCITI